MKEPDGALLGREPGGAGEEAAAALERAAGYFQC